MPEPCLASCTLFHTLAVPEPVTPLSHAEHTLKHAHHATPSEPYTRFCQPLGWGSPLLEPFGFSCTPMKESNQSLHLERLSVAGGAVALPHWSWLASQSS